MSEVRRDVPPDEVPPERGDRVWGRGGYGDASNWWWWVIAIIIIGLIIWWIVAAATPTRPVAAGPNTTGGQVGTGGARTGTGGGGTTGAGPGGTTGGSNYGAGGGGVTAMSVTPAALLANPSRYYGRAVTVTSAIGQTLGPSAIVLNGTTGGGTSGPAASGPQQILVVGNLYSMPSLRLGQVVSATGTVMKFNAAQIGKSLGVSLSDSRFRSWNSRPAIVANNVSVVAPPGNSGGSANSSGGNTGTGSAY